MKPSTELHDLIRSLTKSERRYFKLHSGLQGGPKNYMRIFDAIDEQPAYDEDALREKFKNEKFLKHFPSEKNHLYQLIMNALRAYHAESSISGILKLEIKSIEILYRKALYTECNKTLHRAKRIARENEKFYYWFELLNWEKSLLEEAYESGEFTKDLDALIQEEADVIERLRNLAAYHVLYSKINYVFRSGGYVRSDEEHAMVEEIREHPLIKGKNTALSKRAATICFYTQGFCNWAKRDWKASLEKFSRAKEILDGRPEIKADLAKRYVRTLHYIVNCHIELGQFAEARTGIDELHALEGAEGFGGRDLETQLALARHLSELRLFDRSGYHTGALPKIEAILHDMERFSPSMHKEHELELQFSLCCVYFGAGEMNKSLLWLNKVINDNEQTLRQDIFSYARLVNLVVHFELGNYELLEYITRSAQRFLNKHHRADRMEVLLIDKMRKLGRAKTPLARRELFKELQLEIQQLLKDPNEGVVLKYVDILAWADSKVRNISFSEAVKRSKAETAKV